MQQKKGKHTACIYRQVFTFQRLVFVIQKNGRCFPATALWLKGFFIVKYRVATVHRLPLRRIHLFAQRLSLGKKGFGLVKIALLHM